MLEVLLRCGALSARLNGRQKQQTCHESVIAVRRDNRTKAIVRLSRRRYSQT